MSNVEITNPGPAFLVDAVFDGSVINFSWTPPLNDGGSPITKYTTFSRIYSAIAGPVVSGEVTQANITPTRGDNYYDIFVYAFNDVGPSISSNVITVTVSGLGVSNEPPRDSPHNHDKNINTAVLNTKVALIIDNNVVDVITTDVRLGSILLSEPVMVDVTDSQQEIVVGTIYDPATQSFSLSELSAPTPQ